MANFRRFGTDDKSYFSSREVQTHSSPGVLGLAEDTTSFSFDLNEERIIPCHQKTEASPNTRMLASTSTTAADDSHGKLKHALRVVRDLIKLGESLGLTYAANFMEHWREGGDDRLGEKRYDETWIDIHGNEKKGKRLSSSAFWPGQNVKISQPLKAHRTKFIKGATERMSDGRLGSQAWVAEIRWSAAAGVQWGLNDLQVSLGPCTLNSRVVVKIVEVIRGGSPLDLKTRSKLIQGDKVRCRFVEWEISLSDRYDWVHGKSGSAGEMPLMNGLHWLRYGSNENPQTILQRLETPYGFGNASFPRVFARPFDIETDRLALRQDSRTRGDLGMAKPYYNTLLSDFEVTV